MKSSRPGRALRGGAAVFCALVVLAVVPALAGAATFTVNTTADNPPAVGQCSGAAGACSLRQAIDAANVVGGSNAIILPAGDYALTIPPEGTDGNGSGDLNVSDAGLTIQGAGARQTIIDATAIKDRVLFTEAGSSLGLIGLTVTGGDTEESGGGIFGFESDLGLSGVSVSGNVSYNEGRGGGIYLEEGSLSIVNSILAHNQNSGDGGAIGTEESDITIENSTLADNVVNTLLNPGDPGWGAFGGAMEINGGALVLKNTTISGNQIIDGNGGGSGSGAAIDSSPETAEIVNTIVADNTGAEVNEPGQCDTTLESLGHNLESVAVSPGEPRCFEGPTDLIADPLLASLANNGGETDTVALGVGSPAIRAGDPAFCPTADQRGFPLPAGVVCDLGAFQTAAIVPVVPSNPPSSGSGTQTKLPAPPPPVIASVKVKKLVKLPKTGKAKLTLAFNEAGKVKVSGKGLKTVSRKVKAGNATLILSAVGKAMKALTDTGKVKVTAKIAFTPTTGAVVSGTHKVTLKLKR